MPPVSQPTNQFQRQQTNAIEDEIPDANFQDEEEDEIAEYVGGIKRQKTDAIAEDFEFENNLRRQ